MQSKTTGESWCLNNPEILLQYQQNGRLFIALVPNRGIVFSSEDAEEFEARLNDLRPSVRKQLFLTHISLWFQPLQYDDGEILARNLEAV